MHVYDDLRDTLPNYFKNQSFQGINLYGLLTSVNYYLAGSLEPPGEVNVSNRRKPSVHASAVARHVTADGCQFVIEKAGVAAGQCFCFVVDDHPPVRGTVRWVVRDRIGFAFDRPISRAAQIAMLRRSKVVQGVDLQPV